MGGRISIILKKRMLSAKKSTSALVALILSCALCSVCVVYAQDGYSFVKMWGSQGTSDGQFTNPLSIAADLGGNIYVVDSSNNRVQKFFANGTFITKWGIQGSAPGQFNSPVTIAVDPVGNVYVSDLGNDRIQKFTANGIFVTEWGNTNPDWRELFGGDCCYDINRPAPFPSPPGIAVDPAGNTYVADTPDHKIKKFSTDGSSITEWGENGIGDGQFSFPSSIATDPAGNVYVYDSGNYRIQVFTSEGEFITKWGSQGAGDGQFSGQSSGITVDRAGSVYVADSGNNRIQAFITARPSPT
jgi:tripartite motif-containing protein 71